MGQQYSTVAINGYNSSPPPDDSSQTANNLITWATQKTKLADPVKTAVEAINTALVSAFDYSVRQITANENTVASDHMRCVEIAPTVTPAITVSLGDAATMTNTYRVFVKNSSARNQTVGRVTGTDTIDGTAGNVTLSPGEGRVFQANSTPNGYVTVASHLSSFIDSNAVVSGSSDGTKKLRFEVDGLTSGATRVLTAQDQDGTLTLTFQGAFKNRLLNPAFEFDQRNGGAGTVIGNDAYCFDRHYILTQTSGVNVSQQTNQEDGTPFNIRLTQSQAAAQRMGLAQIVLGADSIDLRGKPVALSIRARISNSQALRYAILEWTGTVDSVTSDVVLGWTSATYTAGNFFLAANLTVTAVGSMTPSANTWTTLTTLTGTLSSSLNNLIVFVWTEGTAAQNVTLDVGYWQLERGVTATEFERRPVAAEVLLCQRFFYKWAPGASKVYGVGQCFSGTHAFSHYHQFPVEMRSAPTATSTSANSDFSLSTAAGGTTAVTTLGSIITDTTGAWTNDVTASGGAFTAGDASILSSATGSANFSFTSEL